MTDFLVEIHTEELPPKSLKKLADHFSDTLQNLFTDAGLLFKSSRRFATPRRIAAYMEELATQQPDQMIERKGPALSAAYEEDGTPTPACLGFARSCNISPDQLMILKNSQGEWVGYQQKKAGKTAQELIPDIVQQALAKLPIAKRMRWGNSKVEFVRPVHSVILLYGKEIISADILGVSADNKTVGHRFHAPKSIAITSPEKYAEELAKHYVIADFEERKKIILNQIEKIVQEKIGSHAHALISPELLDEVIGIVEWPVALCGKFDEAFLTVPPEALISAMQDHQRYFPVLDAKNRLLPYFVTISNIISKNPEQVIEGNERVLRARLSDAKFFFEVDKKQLLSDRIELLKSIIFQEKLGTLYNKTERIQKIAKQIALLTQQDIATTQQAAMLCKTDLTTQLVGEFPELQGIAGYYYALTERISEKVALAIREHYLPRFAGDNLPESELGAILAVADRLDTIAGAFSIQQIPTGDKDPFGLRRSAVGLLRIIIQKKWDVDLKALLATYFSHSQDVENCLSFIFERLKAFYQEQAIASDVFAAVAALSLSQPYDIHHRIQAVHQFKQLPEAEALAAANKRVVNLLDKDARLMHTSKNKIKIDELLLTEPSEKRLFEAINHANAEIAEIKDYAVILARLAKLKNSVDDFFEHVLVMTEDTAQRENRLLLLLKLRELFLTVADIALLQAN